MSTPAPSPVPSSRRKAQPLEAVLVEVGSRVTFVAPASAGSKLGSDEQPVQYVGTIIAIKNETTPALVRISFPDGRGELSQLCTWLPANFLLPETTYFNHSHFVAKRTRAYRRDVAKSGVPLSSSQLAEFEALTGAKLFPIPHPVDFDASIAPPVTRRPSKSSSVPRKPRAADGRPVSRRPKATSRATTPSNSATTLGGHPYDRTLPLPFHPYQGALPVDPAAAYRGEPITVPDPLRDSLQAEQLHPTVEAALNGCVYTHSLLPQPSSGVHVRDIKQILVAERPMGVAARLLDSLRVAPLPGVFPLEYAVFCATVDGVFAGSILGPLGGELVAPLTALGARLYKGARHTLPVVQVAPPQPDIGLRGVWVDSTRFGNELRFARRTDDAAVANAELQMLFQGEAPQCLVKARRHIPCGEEIILLEPVPVDSIDVETGAPQPSETPAQATPASAGVAEVSAPASIDASGTGPVLPTSACSLPQ
jgi:hypothetical protein